MKIKLKIIGMLLLLGVVLFAFKAPKVNYKIDTQKSTIQWTGYHLAKSYEHVGNVNIQSGSLALEDGKLSAGSFVIDMTSITNSDLTDAGKNGKLVGHLKSDDFFNVEKYPTAKLIITQANDVGNGKFKVMADLTIRGITKPIEFETMIEEGKDDMIMASAEFNVERTQYEVMYGWSIENAMLDDDFTLKIDLTAKKSNS